MVRSAAGYKFNAALKKDKAEKVKYDNLGHHAKQEMRVDWHRANLACKAKKWNATRTMKQQDKTRGRWLTARKIAIELGNDWEAAVQYCKSCIAIGPSDYVVDVQA